jgi:hypothetical protein
MTRLQRALIVRDAVLAWLRDHGITEIVSGMRVLGGEVAPYRFIHRTPFTELPDNLNRDYQYAVLLQERGRPVNLPYGLDVCLSGCKVMNLEWDNDGSPDLVSFAKGDWDGQLLDMVAPAIAT